MCAVQDTLDRPFLPYLGRFAILCTEEAYDFAVSESFSFRNELI